MLPATTVELYDGLAASSLPGQGRLATIPDPARYDAVHAHCDLLVVGAGPAGLAAAAAAATSGARVILADDRPEPGGSLLGTGEHLDWVADVAGRLATAPEVRVLPRTTVFGHYDDNHLLAVERRTNHLGAAAPPTSPANASGASAPDGSSSPPAPTNAHSPSRTTTAPG